MRTLPKLTLALLLSSCFQDSPADHHNQGSTGSTTGTDAGSGDETSGGETSSSSSSTSSTGSDTGTTGPDVPDVEPWDPCESEGDCGTDTPLCVVDDYGRGVCTRVCESNLQCPQPPTGEAEAVCTPSKVCLLNCSGDLGCPDGMFCTNTHYNDGFTGGVCLWDAEPEACAEATQGCTSGNDCCEGLQCTAFQCG